MTIIDFPNLGDLENLLGIKNAVEPPQVNGVSVLSFNRLHI